MKLEEVTKIWNSYIAGGLIRTIDDSDDMFNKTLEGWDGYYSVGLSASKIILSNLLIAQTDEINTVVDFGCGHGRVARHLKLLFPSALHYYVDIDKGCVDFCTNTFGGIGVYSEENFAEVEIPKNVDLIFLGSVFTHLTWDRSLQLFDLLMNSLSPGGIIVASFRGRTTYNLMTGNPNKYNHQGYYQTMIDDYINHGFGYQDYKGFENWGQNIFSLAAYEDLIRTVETARLINLTEAGWSNIHDVLAITKRVNWSQ